MWLYVHSIHTTTPFIAFRRLECVAYEHVSPFPWVRAL